jgi:methionyl-tRNA formyltransferase
MNIHSDNKAKGKSGHILLLGPPRDSIVHVLSNRGYVVDRSEDPLMLDELLERQYALVISYGYRHIISPEFIKLFDGRLINLHISLLPWNRGAHPNIWAILENTPKGVTIHRIDKGLDTGDILLQEELVLDEESGTFASTYAFLLQRVEQLLVDNLSAILDNSLESRAQLSGGSIHYKDDFERIAPLFAENGWDTLVRVACERYRNQGDE